jgi:hypothetical protein
LFFTVKDKDRYSEVPVITEERDLTSSTTGWETNSTDGSGSCTLT